MYTRVFDAATAAQGSTRQHKAAGYKNQDVLDLQKWQLANLLSTFSFAKLCIAGGPDTLLSSAGRCVGAISNRPTGTLQSALWCANYLMSSLTTWLNGISPTSCLLFNFSFISPTNNNTDIGFSKYQPTYQPSSNVVVELKCDFYHPHNSDANY